MGDSHNGSGYAIDELCRLILARHHAYLHRILPLIGSELARLNEAECEPPGVLGATRELFAELANQLKTHMAKEENLLFPAIEALAEADREGGTSGSPVFATLLHPIRVMESEHARIEGTMARLRELTHVFAAPAGAADAWRGCLWELAQLDADLREHHRVENEVLFPRALELERRLS